MRGTACNNRRRYSNAEDEMARSIHATEMSRKGKRGCLVTCKQYLSLWTENGNRTMKSSGSCSSFYSSETKRPEISTILGTYIINLLTASTLQDIMIWNTNQKSENHNKLLLSCLCERQWISKWWVLDCSAESADQYSQARIARTQHIWDSIYKIPL